MMKEVTWHGAQDVRVDTVDDPTRPAIGGRIPANERNH